MSLSGIPGAFAQMTMCTGVVQVTLDTNLEVVVGEKVDREVKIEAKSNFIYFYIIFIYFDPLIK